MTDCTICVTDDDGFVRIPCARCIAAEQAEIDAYEAEYGMMTGAEAVAEMMAAQYDDDPNPYHGTY
jgi:hypothetical protein